MSANRERVIATLLMTIITMSMFQVKTVDAVIDETSGATLHTEVEERTYEPLQEFVITGYCGCAECCGQYSSTMYRPNGQVITASGKVAISGYTCASSYPFGTKFEITFQDGHTEIWECMDRGVSGQHLDLYYETHEEALSVGRQTVGVRIIEESIH